MEQIQDIVIQDSVKASYLDYSMSVIVGRALPDAKDGLKPVHRRILYAMHNLNITSKSAYKKSARIVGDVIGKYHPHGDSSVYEALVRMAQDFSMRMPLIDGQGNFGSIDGDNAAAMRYTEARMTKIAEDALKDIEKDTVDFNKNYDDTIYEPSTLPIRFPNLLLNGSSGIAVGMATNIPPHNLSELIDGLLATLENPDIEIDELITHIKAPDFPTAGTIYGRKGIYDAYTTGRGKIKIRAKSHIETKKNREVIVIDELPYQVNKSRLIEQIANLVKEKTIVGISEIRDESDRDGIRVVIELKKDVFSDIILNHLYKSTSLEITFGIILLAVNNQKPKIYNLKELLEIFISYRKTVVIRRTIFDLEKAKAKAHILEGLKIALENIDEVIKTVKGSKNSTEAKETLVSKFDFSINQVTAILDMRLQKLTGLEQEKLNNELTELNKLIEELSLILKDENRLKEIIREEIEELKKYSTDRKTDIIDSYDDIDIEDLIPNEPMVVTMTHNGYIKRVPIKSYETQRRGGKGKTAVKTHEDDFIERFFISNTHDTLLFVTNFGQLYWLKVYKIPEASRTAKGKAVVNLINLKKDEKIMATIPTTDFSDTKSLAFFTKNGVIKRTNLTEFSNIRTNGVKAILLDENDELVTAKITLETSKYLMIFSAYGQCVRFDIEKTRAQGRNTRGVRGIKFKTENDYTVDADVMDNEEQELLIVSEKGMGKRTKVEEYRLTNRGGSGVKSMKLSPRAGKKVVGTVIVEENQDLMLLTTIGKMIRVDIGSIRKVGRNSTGVTVVNMDKGDTVVSIAKCPKENEEEIILDV